MKQKMKNITIYEWLLSVIVVLLAILSVQLGLLSRQVYYTQNTLITHDRIVLEALSCVEDPDCNIDLDNTQQKEE